MPRAPSIRPRKRKESRKRPQRPPAKRSSLGAIEEGWSLCEVAGLEILSANIFDSLPWMAHGFSTRNGGASKVAGKTATKKATKVAGALNLGFTEWDSRQTVARNRADFLRAVLDKKPTQSASRADTGASLVTLRQIHSDVVRIFSTPAATAPQADAAISSRAGLFLGIQTADCVPILLADPRLRVMAAVHAGWRGTLARIAVKTLGRMRLEFGTNPEDVLAALGPAIGPCCYEVGPEVAQAFLGQFAHAAEWFEGPFERLSSGEEPNPLPWLTMMPPGHEPPPERVQLDLRSANRRQLVDAGMRPRNIAVSALCTSCRGDLFFSYRKEGPATGRMMSVVGILGQSR
jgi:polyphenol oxidase